MSPIRHDVWFDELVGVVRIRMHRENTPENIRSMLKEAAELLRGKARRLVITDLTGSTVLNHECRAIVAKEGPPFDRFAFVGASPVVRVLGKTIMLLVGKSDKTRFCTSDAEAVAWIKSP